MLICLRLKKAKHESVSTNYKQIKFKSDSPAIEQHADLLSVHVALTATLSEVGRQSEAQKAASEILRLNPDFSTKTYLGGLSYKDPAELARFENGLINAGLPE